MLIRYVRESGYYLLFDENTGLSLRVSDCGRETFWNKSGPELLDISITNYCENNCGFCYRQSNKNGKFMSLADFDYILGQSKDLGVLQIALGGGNPNQHPDFIEFLHIASKNHIVPSYTTNGHGITDDILKATKKYCGAMAVSWYTPQEVAIGIIERCNEYKIKLNIHYLLNAKTIKDALILLKSKEVLEKINAIIFLNYKPTNATTDMMLNNSDYIEEFFGAVVEEQPCKIGFDSCMISYLARYTDKIKTNTIDFCEAGRFSAFISENLLLYPCSFLINSNFAGIDIKKVSIQQGWKNGEAFIKTREALTNNSCSACEKFDFCHGGCPIFDINYCRGEYRR